jgi:fused signal recognition particle receptor
MDLVIIDTAGRLSTQAHLMDELKKVKRVITKSQEDAPHETVLVIDGNTGQNGLSQVKAFHEALGLTAIIVTKLDGTAKGGILCAIAEEIPENTPSVLAIGLGEKLGDLKPFNASDFAKSLIP